MLNNLRLAMLVMIRKDFLKMFGFLKEIQGGIEYLLFVPYLTF